MSKQIKNLIPDRLNWLFEHVRKSDGTPYSNQEVEEGTARFGRRVTAPAIWKIREGRTENPGALTMQAIANFFGIDVRIFFDETITEQDLQASLTDPFTSDPKAVEIAMRAARLTDEHQEMVLGMMRLIAQQEGYKSSSKPQGDEGGGVIDEDTAASTNTGAG